jgi:hypothetical protein
MNSTTHPTRLVAVNALGKPIGQDHPRAKLTDANVASMLELRDEGWSYARLAAKFEVNKSCAYKVCAGLTRAQYPESYKRMAIKPRAEEVAA